MARFTYLRTASSMRRARRAAFVLALMAALLKAMAVPAAAAPSLWSIKLARQSFGCQRGLGICIDPFGPLDGTVRTPVALEVGRRGIVSYTEPRMLRMAFLAPVQEEGDTFHLEEDVVLDRRRSLELGYQQVTMLKGAYPITRTSDNPHGEVQIALRTIGITITADIGRKSKNCTGFGICSVTIEADLMSRPAPGSVTLDGNRLGWDFLLEIEDEADSSMIYVDEDIELDAATSLALGAKNVVIRKGAYPVDYSDNPNGHVDFNVKRTGITIEIGAYRKIYDCTRGFGICYIRIHAELGAVADNPTPGVATLDGNKLTIDFARRSKTSEAKLTLDAAYDLEPAVAKSLGRLSVTLLPGEYEVDYRTNPNGTVTIPVRSVGVALTIKIGRAWNRCFGVGICGITLDWSAEKTSSPMYRAFGVYSDGVTRLVFAEPTGDTVLAIDDDIVLDAETARALGVDRLTIKRGSYSIDRSEESNGTLGLFTADDGTASVGSVDESTQSLGGYPNPASDRTTLRFGADGASDIRLDLLDAQGSVVMTIVDGERLERGEHERTISVAALPAGAYFQRLTVGSTTTIRALQVTR